MEQCQNSGSPNNRKNRLVCEFVGDDASGRTGGGPEGANQWIRPLIPKYRQVESQFFDFWNRRPTFLTDSTISASLAGFPAEFQRVPGNGKRRAVRLGFRELWI